MADDRQPDDAELASAYLDGEATPDERARVEADPILLAEVDLSRRRGGGRRSGRPVRRAARSSDWRSAGDVRRVTGHGRGAGAAHPAGQRRVARSPAPGAGDAGADGRRGGCRAGDRRFRRRQPRRSRRLRRRHPSGAGHGVGGGHGSSDHGVVAAPTTTAPAESAADAAETAGAADAALELEDAPLAAAPPDSTSAPAAPAAAEAAAPTRHQSSVTRLSCASMPRRWRRAAVARRGDRRLRRGDRRRHPTPCSRTPTGSSPRSSWQPPPTATPPCPSATAPIVLRVVHLNRRRAEG